MYKLTLKSRYLPKDLECVITSLKIDDFFLLKFLLGQANFTIKDR